MQHTKSKTPRLKYLLLAAVLALCVSGCGGGETPAPAPTPAPETVAVTQDAIISLGASAGEQPTEELQRVTFHVYGTKREINLPEGTLVWIPATGEKFHIQNKCGNMNPDKAKQITVEEAKELGYEACSKCY